MKHFNKRGTAIPFFTPIIAIIIMMLLTIGMMIYQAVTYEEPVETPTENVEVVQE